jgi:hypothetical protein
MSNKVQYILRTYDENGKETTRDPFFIEEGLNFRTVLRKLIDVLRDYNFDISLEKLRIVIGHGDNPHEVDIILERSK